ATHIAAARIDRAAATSSRVVTTNTSATAVAGTITISCANSTGVDRCALSLQLTHRCFRLHDDALVIEGHAGHPARLDTHVPLCGGVPGAGVGEPVLLPIERRHALADGGQEHVRVLQTR